jgi:glycerol-3-phosphate dehydrogenase subunit B
MLDLLVVGAGLSGLMAAHTAAQAGLKVKIVNKGLGALHWSAGTIDVLGYTSGTDLQEVQRPLEGVAKLAEENPSHPYALLDSAQISNALQTFRELAESLGLPYGGAANVEENLLLPSPAGAVRPTFLAPQAQLAGDLSRPEPLLIAGFEGMRDFYPFLIAENLTKAGYQARAIMLPKDMLTSRRDANTVQLAQELDDEARWSKLGKHLKNLLRLGERIGLPAVLGLHAHSDVIAGLEQICGVPVFEIPTMPPSVPGIRLFTALQNNLRSMNVRVETSMEVTEAQKTAAQNGAAGHLEWLESKTTTRPIKHRAENFLLATGGILGGGFNSDQYGRVWEVILDLPLTVPQDRSEWFDSSFLSPVGHPVYTGGVKVNADFQPVSAAGKVIYDNLWAVGHMLAGTDPILERSIEGIAIVTGIAAGKAVAAK